MTKVSIIVPVYNQEDYLIDCLDSLTSQIYDNIEIICVNDGSTDNSKIILDDYATSYSNIKVISKKNSGLAATRNVGLLNSTGDLISFVDGDDYLDYDTIDKAVNAFSKDKSLDIYMFGTNIVCDSDYPAERLQRDKQFYKLPYKGSHQINHEELLSINASVCNKIFRADIIRNNSLKFVEGLHYEDYAFCWMYYAFCKTVYYDTTTMYNYRRHSNSIMSNTFNSSSISIIDHFEIFKRTLDFYLQNNINMSNVVICGLFKYCFHFVMKFSTDEKLTKQLVDNAMSYLQQNPTLDIAFMQKIIEDELMSKK